MKKVGPKNTNLQSSRTSDDFILNTQAAHAIGYFSDVVSLPLKWFSFGNYFPSSKHIIRLHFKKSIYALNLI